MTRSLYLMFSYMTDSSSKILFFWRMRPSIRLWQSSCLPFKRNSSYKAYANYLGVTTLPFAVFYLVVATRELVGGSCCCCFFLSSGKQSPFISLHFFSTSNKQACWRLQLTSLCLSRFCSYFSWLRISSVSFLQELTPPSRSSLMSFSMTLSCTFVTFLSPSIFLMYSLICASIEEMVFSSRFMRASLSSFSSLPLSASMVRLYISICRQPFYNSLRRPAAFAVLSFSSRSSSSSSAFFLGTNFLCFSCSVSSSLIFFNCLRSSSFFWLSLCSTWSRSASSRFLRRSERREPASSEGEQLLAQSME